MNFKENKKKTQMNHFCLHPDKFYVIISTHIMNLYIFAILDYSRVEVAVDARRRSMKLWSSTANGPQRSRCGEIGSPKG